MSDNLSAPVTQYVQTEAGIVPINVRGHGRKAVAGVKPTEAPTAAVQPPAARVAALQSQSAPAKAE